MFPLSFISQIDRKSPHVELSRPTIPPSLSPLTPFIKVFWFEYVKPVKKLH